MLPPLSSGRKVLRNGTSKVADIKGGENKFTISQIAIIK
jgi:hypothetical protein